MKALFAAVLTILIMIIGLKVFHLIVWGLFGLVKLAIILACGLLVYQVVRKALA